MRSIWVALVRHAPTTWNAERRVVGRADPPLSPDGARRARQWRLPADLRALDAAGALGWVASPLRRAVETAHALGARALVLEPSLVERDWGAWTGRPLAELPPPPRGAGWAEAPPGGEAPSSVRARLTAWLEVLAGGGGPDRWVAVTHQGVIRVLLASALRWDLDEPPPVRLLPDRLHRIRRRGDGVLQVVTLNEPLVAAP